MIGHTIDLRLNSTGYSGADVDEILPDFITERDTNVGLTWYRSANGPESLTLVVCVSVVLSSFLGEFVKHLSADLYGWTKEKLLKLFAKKKHPDFYVSIKLEDVEVIFHDEDLFDDDRAGEIILSFFENIPRILQGIEPSKAKTWLITFDKSRSEWNVLPFE